MSRSAISSEDVRDIIREDLEQFEKTISEIENKTATSSNHRKAPSLNKRNHGSGIFHKNDSLR
jgi:hypothetical protein